LNYKIFAKRKFENSQHINVGKLEGMHEIALCEKTRTRVYKDEKDPNWIAWLRSSNTRHQVQKGQ